MASENKKSAYLLITAAAISLCVSVALVLVYTQSKSPNRGEAMVKLYDNNNDFKTSRAPGPMVQDILAKPFDESFRELVRRTEEYVSDKSESNIFNYFTIDDFNKVYVDNPLGISNLKVNISDSGMFRNIEGSGDIEIEGVLYNCNERVDLVNSDVLVLRCEVKNA